MNPNLRSFALTLALCGCIGCAANQAPQTQPAKPIDLLRQRAPGAEWRSQSLLAADLDQDGTEDTAALGLGKDKVVVGIVQAGGEVSTLEFGWQGGQDELCSKDAAISLERLEEVEGPEDAPRQGSGINLHDDQCDSFHIFWNPKKQRFEYWRL